MNKIKALLKKYNDIPVAAKAAIWFVFASTLQRGIAVITTPIFSRLMTPEQYGQYNVYNSWLNIFTILTTLRLNWEAFNKGMSKYKDDRDGYTSTMQTITFVITGVLFLIYLLFRERVNALTELPTFIMVAMFAELFVMPAVDFWSLRKRYEYQYRPVVLRTVIFTILNAAIGIAAVWLSDEKGYARILSCTLVNFCFGVMLFVYNRRKGKIWFRMEYAVFAISFVLPLVLHYFSQYVLDQFDRIMIQKMVGLSAAGVYGVAYNAGMLLKILTSSIRNALIPWQYDRLEKRKFRELDDVLFLVFLLVAVCMLLFTAFAPELMMILADEAYLEATYVIPPVTMGLFFCFMYTVIANVEFFYDQTKYTIFVSMSGAVLNIVLNYFGIKYFGYIAAAYTTLFCYIYFAVVHYIYMSICVRKAIGVRRVFDFRRISLLSAGFLVIGIAMILLYNHSIFRYTVIVAACVLLYLNRKRFTETISQVRSVKRGKRESEPVTDEPDAAEAYRETEETPGAPE